MEIIKNSWKGLQSFLNDRQETIRQLVILNLFGYFAAIVLKWWCEVEDKRAVENGSIILDGPGETKPTEQIDHRDPSSFEVKPLARWNLNEDLQSGKVPSQHGTNNQDVRSHHNTPSQGSTKDRDPTNIQIVPPEKLDQVREKIKENLRRNGKVTESKDCRNCAGLRNETKCGEAVQKVSLNHDFVESGADIQRRPSNVHHNGLDVTSNIQNKTNHTNSQADETIKLKEPLNIQDNIEMFSSEKHKRSFEENLKSKKPFSDSVGRPQSSDSGVVPITFNFNEELLSAGIEGADCYLKDDKIVFNSNK